MARYSLTIDCLNPSPQPNGAPVVSTTGGSIGEFAHLSFAIVANFQPYDGTGDADWFGVDRSVRVAHVWDDLATGSSGTSKITFPITPPMVQVSPAYHPVYPRSYLVLVQENTSFDFDLPAAVVLESFESSASSLVVLDDVEIKQLILPEPVQIVTHQLYRLEAVEREMTSIIHNGYVAGRSMTNFSDVKQINVVFPGGSITHAEANRIKKWRQSGRIHVRVTDHSSGDAATDPYTATYDGKIVASNYTNSRGKDPNPEFMFSVAVYHTDVSTGVPINDTDVPE